MVEEMPQRIARLTPLDDVLARIDALVKPIAARTADLSSALGFTLAADILIGRRAPIAVDFALVLHRAREVGCALELDAQPLRLDLDDLHCREAKEAGVLISINSDAHSAAELRNLRYGVEQARRGWLARQDVLNTRPLAQLQAFLKRR